MEEEQNELEKVKKSNKILKIVVVVLIIIILGVVAIYLNKDSLFKSDSEEVVEDIQEETTEEQEKTEEESIPTDEELIERSKTLYKNVNNLYKNNTYTSSVSYNKSYTIDGISNLYKYEDPTEVLSVIEDTYVDFETATKYMPIIEKDGSYYTCDCSGGGSAGYLVFEYEVTNKTASSATVIVTDNYCRVEADSISSCSDLLWDDSIYTFNLVKQDGVWLISSLESDKITNSELALTP